MRAFFTRSFLCLALLTCCSARHKWEFPPEVEVYFSPGDHLANHLVEQIDLERYEIGIAIYCLSHLKILSALEKALSRGVKVTVLLDPFSLTTKKEAIEALQKAGAKVYVWDPKTKNSGSKKGAPQGLMHHKFCVLGCSKVWTGSFNFTHPADQRHQENALFITDTQISTAYYNQLQKMIELGGVPFQAACE